MHKRSISLTALKYDFQKHATIFPCFISQVFANEQKLGEIFAPVKSNIQR